MEKFPPQENQPTAARTKGDHPLSE